MEISARLAGRGRPPRGESLFLRDGMFIDADFSRRKLDRMGLISSTFTRCRFERMRVRDAALGVRSYPSEFIECSFDGSSMSLPGSGSARFVRCSFRDVALRHWTADTVEVIDCVFTGTMHEVLFFGRPLARGAKRTGRERNEFHGNDFTGVTSFDVDFRCGVDLSRQILPQGEDFLYLPDAGPAVAAARAAVAAWPPGERRDNAERMLGWFARDVEDGQRQLLLKRSDWNRYGFKPVVTEVFGLLRGGRAAKE
jgi:hypothetical protein